MVVIFFLSCFKEPLLEPIPPRSAINIEVNESTEVIVEIFEPPVAEAKTGRIPRIPKQVYRRVYAMNPSPVWEEYPFVTTSFPSSITPTNFVKKEDLQVQWENNHITIVGNTQCLETELEWVLLDNNDNRWREGTVQTSRSGFIDISSPINPTRLQLELQLNCDGWSLIRTLHREEPISNIQVYGKKDWFAGQSNSFIITGATNSELKIWGRPIGNILWKDKYRIGMGESFEWKLLHQQYLTSSFEQLSILIDDLFQQPYEIVIQIIHPEEERQFYSHLFSAQSMLGIHSPQSVLVNTVVPLHFLVESLKESTTNGEVSVRISNADQQKQLLVPIENGTGSVNFTPTIGGLYHIVAEFNSQRSETYLWVEGNNGDLEPTAISFPTATYIGGLSTTMIVDGQKVTNGLLYNEAKEVLWLGKEDKQRLPVLSLSTDYLSLQSNISKEDIAATTILNIPTFIRLGDHIELEIIEWNGSYVQQKNHIFHSRTLLPISFEGQVLPVVLSPSDQMLSEHHSDSVYNSSKRIAIDFPPAEFPYYLSTDPHFPAHLLSQLLDDLYQPHTPIEDALFLQKAALAWDSLALRKAPWFHQILRRAQDNIRYLIDTQSVRGHWGTPKEDWMIVHALLILGEQGGFSSYPTMAAAAEYLCQADSSLAIDHVRQLLDKSIWRSLSCNLSPQIQDAHPIWTALWESKPFTISSDSSFSAFDLGALLQHHADVKPYVSSLEPYIEEAKRNPDPWLEFSLWKLTKARYDKYTNMRVYEYREEEGIQSGLFHTWQLSNLFSLIESPDKQQRDLVLQGSGTLHWTLWNLSPQHRSPLSEENLKIERSLQYIDGQPVDRADILKGQALYLFHKITGPPGKEVTVSIFPAAGVSMQSKGSQVDRSVLLNDNGEALIEDQILSQFKGSFQFPASTVSIDDQQAHSGDWQIIIK